MPQSYPLITLRNDVNPWEQQEPKESALMYSRFQIFMQLPPEVDRLRQTMEILNATAENKITFKQLKDYAHAFRWQSRAGAHDRYLAQADQARMIKQRRRVRDEQLSTASTLRNTALVALKQIPIEDLTPQDVVRFVDLAWRLEKSLFEEVGLIKTDANDGKAEVLDVASWSPADRRRRLEVLRDELAARATRAADDDEVVA